MSSNISAGAWARESDSPSRADDSINMPDAKPVRILHIINDLSIGGAEMMLYRLLSQKSRQRFAPVVISLMDRGSLREQIEGLGIPVYTARMKPGLPTPSGIWRLIRLARQIKPDLIQGWLYHGSLAAQIAGLGLAKKVPVLWSIHCSIYSLSFEKKLTAVVVRLCALLSKLASDIIFVSRTSRSQHEALGYRIEHSCVIPNGIDTNLFAPDAEARVSVRTELGLPLSALLIGVIGRFHQMKDHANFLNAAGQITKRYPDAHFLLAGRDVDPENRALTDLIRKLGLAERTHLLGERTDVARLVAALDIFCLSSSHGESFPIIVGEAMSSEIPCVVTDVGDVAWMVSETGQVVPPRDPVALAAACETFLNLGPQGLGALGQAARIRVVDLFSLSSVVAKYEELYDSTMARTVTVSGDRSVEYQPLGRSSPDESGAGIQ